MKVKVAFEVEIEVNEFDVDTNENIKFIDRCIQSGIDYDEIEAIVEKTEKSLCEYAVEQMAVTGKVLVTGIYHEDGEPIVEY